MFIVFDGIDGAGKTTQICLLEDWLHSQNIDYLKFREPGGCENAEKIRSVFVENKISPLSQLLLLSAARVENMLMIEDEKRLIICDRFVDSTYAYQGLFLDKKIIDSVVEYTVLRKPDFVFLFIKSYVKKNDNYLDEVTNTMHEHLVEKFKERIDERYFIVPDGSIDDQHSFIVDIFKKFILT